MTKRPMTSKRWPRALTAVLVAAGLSIALLAATPSLLEAQTINLPTLLQQLYQAVTSHDAKLDAHDLAQTQQNESHQQALSQRLAAIEAAIDRLPPVWHRTLASDDGTDVCSSSRFTCVMGGAAVRDNETGLVWQRRPWTTEYSWANARYACADADTGGRRGWRLPSVHELNSLVDPAFPPGVVIPRLPSNHPFDRIQTGANVHYWTATEFGYSDSGAWWVDFGFWGLTGNSDKIFQYPVWCVRGPMSSHEY